MNDATKRRRSGGDATDPGSPPEAALDEALAALAAPVVLNPRDRSAGAPLPSVERRRTDTEPYPSPALLVRPLTPEAASTPSDPAPRLASAPSVSPATRRLTILAVAAFAALCAAVVGWATYRPSATPAETALRSDAIASASPAIPSAGGSAPAAQASSVVVASTISEPATLPATSMAVAKPSATLRPSSAPSVVVEIRPTAAAKPLATPLPPSTSAPRVEPKPHEPPPKNDGPGNLL